jgi:hypothetical protein
MNVKRKLFVLITQLILTCSVLAQGQTQRQAATRKAANATKRSSSRAETRDEKNRETRRLWLSMALSSVYDTNINHDEESVNSFGLVPSLGMHFRDNAEKPSFEADYEVALHRYSRTSVYNRISQNMAASYRRQLGRKLQSKTAGEISLKGSSEDRDVNNQYTLEQQMQYRLNPNNRVRVFGAYRLKRYPSIDRGKNAVDPYIGARFDQKLKGGRGWEIMYRYDKNRSQDPKDRYVRRTYGAQFQTPLFKERHDQLTLEVNYAPRLYARQLKVDGVRVPRLDRRWVMDVLYERPLSPAVQMGLNYRYETRNSNDPDKKFNSHLLGVTFNFQWWK